jgi:ribosomal protein S17E
MGRIKSIMVKRAARQLLEGEHDFNGSFEHNKKLLGNTMPSKPIRNKIAGYMARLLKGKKSEPIENV